MSFRKRNVGLTGLADRTSGRNDPSVFPKVTPVTPSPGIRPSPLDGRSTTSTGTQSFDDLLGGHAGLALGNSIMIEESGTTDFAGALLRYYAAEGIVQGHKVHVVGVPEQWGRELPGLGGSGTSDDRLKSSADVDGEKMKIAWRYERLGEFGSGTRAPPTPDRSPKPLKHNDVEPAIPTTFCHNFDLTKRLTNPSNLPINFIPVPATPAPTNTSSPSPYTPILASLTASLTATPPQTIHRLIIPSLLSPALYPLQSSDPTYLLPFLHSLRSLLRTYPARLTTMLTLPLSLHPRSTGLVCWIEQLCDGVIELAPFPHRVDLEPPIAGAGKTEEKAQGMVKVHKLPVVTEKGCGSGGGDDLAFELTRKRFSIKPFSLPPMQGDNEAQSGEGEGGKVNVDIEF